ncbi:PD-(D/E)XK nuclease superfamily protein [Gelidibacter algens]|uniref:PD-(D/E)XK nuclease superfamily protein n=1 Tax=Gelidibacter algens TaxID=49280 RepID=A0A1A7R4P0_9FLAO|nr:PD-(D/E)XK nuclease family protein [Gelidibacter algens]OBX26821.1 hypothetical protein A9996_03150 [Gelidibacter algens]RAJ22729.1 PD-(D/E)XK nuclease superfamily protein [Gelidibacter algens]
MSVNETSLKHLLSNTGLIVAHNNELTIAKGEHFNIFSVLKIETRENKTHSAFLTELLNPKGSHQMGDVFLKHFLFTINYAEPFDTDNPFVKAEEDIGRIDFKEKEGEDRAHAIGGRIDIYLRDKNGYTISIENKIHAIDQKAQIQRYCNHCKGKNRVYYLALKIKEPENYSKLKLISGEDFHIISYKDHIVDWLELCLREVPNFSTLREAINQYIVLIKKLTHTLNKEQEKKLLDVMKSHLEESRFVADNYNKMVIRLWNNFRIDLKKELLDRINKERYYITIDKKVYEKYSQLWIHFKSEPSPQFLFGVEPFSGAGHKEGKMFIGLYNSGNSTLLKDLEEENKLSNKWKQVRYILTKDRNSISFSDNFTIDKLANQSDNKEYVNLFATQIIKFIEDYEKLLPQEVFEQVQKMEGE